MVSNLLFCSVHYKTNKMSQFKLLTVSDIKNKFPFLKQSKGFDPYENWDDENYFLIAEKDVVLKGNLNLDVFENDNKKDLLQFLEIKENKLLDKEILGILGILLLGDLTVQGCIINEKGDYGPFLYSKGNIECQSLLLGGCYVEIEGDISAEEVVMTHYNHGFLDCKGTVKAPVFIIDDHYTTFGDEETELFYYNDTIEEKAHPKENDCYNDEKTGEWVCSSVLLQHLDNSLTTTFEELHRDLVQGEWVLARSEKPVKDRAYWQQKVKMNYRDLVRVPSSYKDETLYRIALNQSYSALSYIEKDFITLELCLELIQKDGFALRVIPDPFITPELCLAAAEKGTYLPYIPEKYYTEKLILTVMKNSLNEPDIQNVPFSFITKSLLVEYVKLGRGLFLDKTCKANAIDKLEILYKVIDSGVDYLENIFGYHCSKETLEYATKLYNIPEYKEQWNYYSEKYKTKLDRLK